ncbi:hypothetical protein [Thiothrix winogradskyi]|uniref:HD Cas3-type domain-containing protein n=1 Tax=Thiothrix winogradskyi TaxID=96472 RepID=A0ABY3SUT5_9GAMM|nr:hypothetical protein [Thiothrix winogradskyi]UJS22923.1 hypothetical protein L2Y54_13335 [Thiothrix winogradskyi]
MSTAMQRANALAGEIYSRFMQDILEKHVLKERAGAPLGEELKKAIHAEKSIDPRVIYLMSISGKGGWDDDASKRERYLKNQNITLLDHLLSVVRGALMLAALDWLLENPEMDERELRQRLTVLATIAFLHDLDKMLQLSRDAELTVEHVEMAVKRYGITEFLASEEVVLTPDQIRFLIEQAEDSQRYRHPAVVSPPRPYKYAVERYVKLADKLDGLWQEHGAQGGLEAIIQRLQQEQSFSSALLSQWETLDVFDPHHPFLLDELQRRLSFACQRIAGIPPLLEVHQDGRLFMLLPKAQAEKIKADGLKRLISHLPFKLEISISNRGLPELLNGKPDHAGLQAFLEKEPRRTIGQLFRISNSLIESIKQPLDDCLKIIGLAPHWPKVSGQTSTPYPDPDVLEFSAQQYLLKAAHLTLLINLKLPVSKKNGLPDYAERERQLLELVDTTLPEWLQNMGDKQSRYVLVALWVTAVSQVETTLNQRIWGETGLLQQWLEGTEETVGFSQFFEGEGVAVQQAVERHFGQLLGKQRAFPNDEGVVGRCLFTDEPASTLIASNLGLYEVKVSAFSGRDGKPDSITAPANGQVPIGHVSLAEHKLRSDVYSIQGGKPSGVPSMLSSPVTTGLFGALILNNEQTFAALSVYDLSRQKVEPGKAHYKGLEVYRQRYRMARLERIPEKTEDQINMLRLLLSACLRIGRPIHVFRGLPTAQKAFFYFDAMPPVLKALIGYQALRLEQIPDAMATLNMAQTLISTPGLGYDILGLYAFPRTRFSAICLAWCHAHDALKQHQNAKTAAMKPLAARLFKEFQQLEEQHAMSDSDGALVRLGQAATRIQRRPIGQVSTNVEMRVFKICLDSALALRSAGQSDPASLIHGIAGELETNLVRKDEAAAKKHREEQSLEAACMDFAHQFVHEVWLGVLHGKPPAQKTRRLLGSVYRMAFLQAFRNTAINETTPLIEDTTNLEPTQGDLL